MLAGNGCEKKLSRQTIIELPRLICCWLAVECISLAIDHRADLKIPDMRQVGFIRITSRNQSYSYDSGHD